MLKIVIAFFIFCLVLFIYLHVQFHIKTSNDLEVYELDQASKDKLDEICDLRQPVIFDFDNDKILQTINKSYIANNYNAYEELCAEDKVLCNSLRVIHTMQAALFPAKRDCTLEEFALWSSYPNRSHPLVWQHKSGRKSLVLSTSASYVEGMHPAQSHDLLQRLMAHATQPHNVYRHSWQMGDLLIWDNTGTMHRVLPFDEDSGRELHRFTLNGEEPVGAAA